MKQIKIAPSILSADFSKMGEEVISLEQCGADVVHCDVMDGVFVNNITFGIKMVEDIRKLTKLPLDCHLMIVHPEKYVERFAKAGADVITVHWEACQDNLKVVRFTMLVLTTLNITFNIVTHATLFVTLTYVFEMCANLVSIYKYHIKKEKTTPTKSVEKGENK
jgi:ribulose-phosphate 3-epimerase